MENCVNLHSQLASIMEVLANAAVAEICQLVDDGFASLRLEISRNQRENLALKSRLRLMEVRAGERSDTEPSLVVTCARRDHHFEEDDPAITKRNVKSTTPPENSDSQQSQPADVKGQPVEPEVSVIKRERLEEELAGCSALEDHHTAANGSTGPQSFSPAAESSHPQSAGAEIPRVSVSGRFEKQDFSRLVAQHQEEGTREAGTLGRYPHPAEQGHRGPNRDLTKEEDKHVVDPRDYVSAESSKATGPDEETQRLDSDLPLINTGVKGLCGAAPDWRGGPVSIPVKMEAEASWPEAFRTRNASVSVNRSECVSSSRLTSNHHTESGAAELDTNSLDSSSFDDLFSSPEVARSLIVPHKHSTEGVRSMEEPLSSSSFPFVSSGSSFGNSSVSDCLSGSSFSDASSHSKSRSFPSSTERAFSCQQCGRLFSTSRDLVVHQRSHTGERIYYCHLCKKPFLHPHQLKTHQRVHTGEKPFSCAQCGKRFSQSSHIKRHMSVHTGEKRYSCSLCGKRFSQACSLKVHQAVHTGERPYSCTKCGKSFSVLGNLVRHQSVHIGK